MLEYLFVYLKDDDDDDSVLAERQNWSCWNWQLCCPVSLGAGSDAVTGRCSELLSLGMSAGNQTWG